jgi:allantoinase
MLFDSIIRGGNIVTSDGVLKMEIAIADGAIVEVAPQISGTAKEEINATGLHIFPGVIDPHVHFNEPGRTEWEGFATGSAALAAGGGTCFFEMPLNASPPTLDAVSFDLKKTAAEKSSRTDFALWGGLTPDNLDHLEALAERGVVGFKAFMSDSGIEDFSRADDLTLYRGMQIAERLGLPVAVHAESQEITAAMTKEIRGNGGRNWRDYLASRPIVAEIEAIQRAISLAEETGCSLHIVHVSGARGIEIVARAQTLGIDVTCETCPHYLILNGDDLEKIGAGAKCAPPLRSAEENESMWKKIGDIAFVASDHSPAPATMKTGDDCFCMWGGISGVQSTLSILLSREPSLKPQQIAQLTSTNVAERFSLDRKGKIAIGYDADFALVDLNGSFELKREDLLDRHKQSPYVGRKFRGRVRRTISRGTTILFDGRMVGDSRGRLIKPRRKIHA